MVDFPWRFVSLQEGKPCAAGFEIYILCWTIERCMALRSEVIGVFSEVSDGEVLGT